MSSQSTQTLKTQMPVHKSCVPSAQNYLKPTCLCTKAEHRPPQNIPNTYKTHIYQQNIFKKCARGAGRFAAPKPTPREAHPSRAHVASPRPLARTHDTNTKRNRHRFPGLRGVLTVLTPLNLRFIYLYIYIYIHIIYPVRCAHATVQLLCGLPH